MQNRKTPTTLVWMAGILLLVGGFLFIRSVQNNSRDNNLPLNPLPNSTSTDVVGGSVDPNTSTPLPSNSTANYGRATLRLNQTVQFPNASITVVSIEEDSRCPVDVQCIQAGTVKVGLLVKSASGTSRQSISLNNSITTEAEKITFVSVTPSSKQGQTIKPEDYIFTFEVVKRVATAPVSPAPTQGKCYVGGCSGQICSDKPDVASTCEFRAEYACYRTAKCERQASGQCGFTQTNALKMCLANPPAFE